jgi:hypothetical protein
MAFVGLSFAITTEGELGDEIPGTSKGRISAIPEDFRKEASKNSKSWYWMGLGFQRTFNMVLDVVPSSHLPIHTFSLKPFW